MPCSEWPIPRAPEGICGTSTIDAFPRDAARWPRRPFPEEISVMRTLAGWCVRHRRIVVLLWILVLVVSIFSVKAAGTDYSNNFSFPHTQSFDAINLLKSVAPSHSGDQEQVVFGTSGDAKLTDPAVGQRINTMVDKINALPNVTQVT